MPRVVLKMGQGVKQDLTTAYELYKKAASLGDVESLSMQQRLEPKV